LGRRKSPQPHHPVPPPRGEQLAVGAERHGAHNAARLPVEDPLLLTPVPHADAPMFTPNGEQFSVRAERESKPLAPRQLPRVHSLLFPGSHSPHPLPPAFIPPPTAGPATGHQLAVGTEGDVHIRPAHLLLENNRLLLVRLPVIQPQTITPVDRG